ncbi:MAG: DUF5797 family protein [Haloarculaceae archaeon]
MALSEEARERLADVVELQPTKNAELRERWGMDSGSEVHAYLESELGDYYYRDEDSLICATPEAVELVGGDADQTIELADFQAAVVDVLAGPDGEPKSVVATLHALQEAGRDPSVDEVRSTLYALTDRGVVERVQRTVPTFRLAISRERIDARA